MDVRPAPREVRVKGISIRSFLLVLETERGAAVVDRVLYALEPSVANAIRAVTPGGWYPIAWYRALHETTHDVLGVEPSFSRHMGYRATQAELTGIYKVFVKLMTPETALRLGSKLFRTYYDKGYFRVLDWRNGRATGRWEDCHGFSEAIWEDVIGGIRAFLEAAGGKEVRIQVTAGGRTGDAFVELVARWR